MRPPTNTKCLPIFDPQKCYNHLSPPVRSRFTSARQFSVPQVENEVKRTLLCGCCWDPRSRNWWTKEGPKRGIFGIFFRNCTTAQNHVYIYIYMPMELIWIKKGIWLPHMSLKKISPKTFGPHCIFLILYFYGLWYHYHWYSDPTALCRVVAKEHCTFKMEQEANSAH